MLRVCGLFSGIGGFEAGLSKAGFETVLLCENDVSARAVLKRRFADVRLIGDIADLKSLPNCDLVTAGWPCQDLSQAGQTSGLDGRNSVLVREIFRLLHATKRKPQFLLLENVAFALYLHNGRAIRHVVEQLENQGYCWAYRILDTREFGVPQRRRRIFILAARDVDPAAILFNESEPELGEPWSKPELVGFYWTEGNRGIGWTPEGVPPLKGGSGLSIPSPPAVWNRRDGSFISPGIVDAERLQGFPANWTEPAGNVGQHSRLRWRLVGNAVSVPVARWLGRRIASSQFARSDFDGYKEVLNGRGHNAACGGPGRDARQIQFTIEGPSRPRRVPMSMFGLKEPEPLSLRAASGFLRRFLESSLTKDTQFVLDLKTYCRQLRASASV
jgi:DNA (cytosine-5)-methyltransferase 1